MAVVAALLKESSPHKASNRHTEQWYGVSASATDITISTGSSKTAARRLISVSVKYGAAASTTVTVTMNYATPGSTYDVLLNSTLLSAATDFVFQPPSDWMLTDNDTITVLAPALAGQTARVVITLETL